MLLRRGGLAAFVALCVAGALPAAAPADQFKPCVAGGPPPFERYWLGPSFDGLAVTHEGYGCEGSRPPPEPGRINQASVIYGDCDASDGGCAPPVEVQTSPACDRWYGQYPEFSDFFDRPDLTRIRGVPGVRFEDDPQAELYTGDVTVVVFADSQERVDRAIAALRPQTSEGPVAERLPPARRGAISGRLDCGAAFERLVVERRSCGSSAPCAVSLAVRVRRKTYVTADFARRVGRGRYEWEEQEIYTAAAGTTRRTVRLRPGRYRVRAIGWEPSGRRTAPRTYWFRVRRR